MGLFVFPALQQCQQGQHDLNPPLSCYAFVSSVFSASLSYAFVLGKAFLSYAFVLSVMIFFYAFVLGVIRLISDAWNKRIKVMSAAQNTLNTNA